MIEKVQYISIGIIIAGLAFGLIIALLFLYKWFMMWGIKKLEYKRYFSKKGAFEGEEIYFVEEITNRFFMPFRNIDVESHISSGIKLEGCVSENEIKQHFISSFSLMPFTKVKRMHKAKCLKRGHYALETSKIEAAGEDVFIDSIGELNVYPKETPIEKKESLNMYLKYSATSKYPLIEDVFSFSGIRKYEYGDPINSINYKATARMSELMINSREYMMGRKILAYINFQMSENSYIPMEKYEELMEDAMSYVAYIAGECYRAGHMFGFSCNSRFSYGGRSVRYPVSVGKNAYIDILDILANIRPVEGNSILSVIDEDIAENIKGTEIFLFTVNMDISLEERIEALEKMGNAVTVIRLDEL